LENQKLSEKIALGLERISEAYRNLLGQEAVRTGLSPIQIRILIFISHHADTLCNVTSIAKEFNLTKPTISDAVNSLETKKLIRKKPSVADNRSFKIQVTKAGAEIVSNVEDYYTPVTAIIEKLDEPDLESLYASISHLIYNLHKSDVLKVQRTCFACKFYEKRKGHFCQLLNMSLENSDIRLDCAEFESPN